MLLAVGTIPAALVGLTLHGPIEVVFSEPWLAAVALMATGVILLFTMLVGRGLRHLAQGRWTDGVVVGLAQAFALLPGISRSGMTIAAGMAQGFQRKEAARFAFLLATPIIGAAALLKLPELFGSQGDGIRGQALVASLAAAATAYLSVKFLMRYFETRTLIPFAVWSVAFGLFCSVYFLAT